MMLQAGVDYNCQEEHVKYLPLHYYDDKVFDIKKDKEWLQEMDCKLIALQKDIHGSYEWVNAKLIGYNEQKEKFEIQYIKTNQIQLLPKLYCYFSKEKVEVFVERNRQAIEKRVYADSLIRYKQFIDNMPNQEGDELDIEKIRKLEKQAMGKRLEGSDTSELIVEINKDYQNTMNKIIFDKCLKEYNNELLPHHLQLPKPNIKRKQYFGLLELEAKKGAKELQIHNPNEIFKKEPMTFNETFKLFCLESILLKKEIVKSLQDIREQCGKIVDLKLYELDVNGSQRLEEFKNIQDLQSNNGLAYLKQEWVQNVVNIVKTRLGDIQKGWFSLKQIDKENYNDGKLKKFLLMIRQIMQDSLRDCIRSNYEKYVEMVVSYLPENIEIKNSQEVVNTWRESQIAKAGLFLIDLQLVKSKFKYSFMPSSLVTQLMDFFDRLLEELSRIPDIESRIVGDFVNQGNKQEKHLQSPTRPTSLENLNKYMENYEWLYELYQQLNSQLEKGVAPLEDFIKQFDQFQEIVDLDHDSYIKNYDWKEPTEDEDADEVQQIDIIEIADEIKRLNVLEKELKSKIKENIQVGFFQVNCKEVYDFIIKKYQKLQKSLKETISKRAKKDTKYILDKFQNIQNKIQKNPKDVEHLTEIKDFIQNEVPNQLENLEESIQGCMKIFEILDEFQYKINIEELNKKYKILGSTKDTVQIIESRENLLDRDKKKFQEGMRVNQHEFKENMDQLDRTIKNFNQYSQVEKHSEVAKQVQQIQETLNQYIQDAKRFNSRENLFEVAQTDYTKLQNMNKEFIPYSNLWLTTTNWFVNYEKWNTIKWDELDAPSAEKFVEEGLRTLGGVIRYFKDKGQQKILNIAENIREQIIQYRPKIPLMVALRKQGMKKRHWEQISKIIDKEVDPELDDEFNFDKALSYGLIDHVDKMVEIGDTAFKEFQIETMLRGMQKQWEDINWDLAQYKNTYIIKGFDEISNTLDEHIMNSQTMLFSPYKKPFEEEIIEWNDNLKLMSEIMEEWTKCQLNWMYLQPIFDSPDIAKQLPGETKKFKIVDNNWKSSLQQAKSIVNVLKTCQMESLLEKLQQSNESLDVIQKALEDYLEKKRESFPRFYFLANNDLIAILSQTKEPTAVQAHLSKVFENMMEVQFDDKKRIIAMYSAEREKVDFIKEVNPVGKSVEHWMADLEEMMKMSVRYELQTSIESYLNTQRTKWVLQHKGQCVLNGSQVHWTNEVEESINKSQLAIKEYLDKSIVQLNDLVDLVRQKLQKQQIVTLNALIVIDVHARNIVSSLLQENVLNIQAFEWISQLRYYWEKDDCYVKCVQTVFPYGYEYLGNTPRLVITELTDQCYITLMGALRLHLGGAPAGPAGTGKTESTKDLAKALAKQCVVFNCSDQMDVLMVARMFKGLASSGAWCCFDEFNRINIEVLSVIAMQLSTLFGYKAQGITQAPFQGSEIKVLPTFSVYITMNPGYAGRTELPDNLKALFRPMAMMVPDYRLIAEIRLYSFGFRLGEDLSRKMIATFTLSSESLSSQGHYDYGMRAVSSVINAAGILKQQYPEMDENQLLLRALRDVNVPKFLKDDLPLFENIILDLFPGVDKPYVEYGGLLQSIKNTCQEMNLQAVESFLSKIFQLYDTMVVRHGLMLVGPTGGGKTKSYDVLSKSLSKLAEEDYYLVENHILNPKSITMGQLYGEFNLSTREWTDGVLANMIRETVKDLSGKRHWTIFDGPVDALWIESMNTVLDDNKKLCLNSGQIISLSPYMTMIFEVADLSVASPATVSRCGMVYMEPSALGYQPFIKSWIDTLPREIMDKKSFQSSINTLFTHLEVLLEYNRKNSKEIVETLDNDLVQSLCMMLECYLNPLALKKSEKPLTLEQVDQLETILENVFMFSVVWSIGVTGDDQSRIHFDKFFKDTFNSSMKIPFPNEKTVYDYQFDIQNMNYQLWEDQIKTFEVDPNLAYNEIMIPTSDSQRNLYLSKLLINNDKNILTCGPTGTGKTQNAMLLLSKVLGDNYQYVYLAYSAATSANQTQDTIDSKLDKRRRGHYGPPVGKKCVIFIDDLNMPKKEKYFAQPAIEILRQYLDHQGWYDRKALSFMKLEDIILFCAMGPPGGGRTLITPRMTRHFNLIGYTELEQHIVSSIFSTITNSFLKKMTDEIKEYIPQVIANLLECYNQTKQIFLPTPAKCHYLFNLRDISRVVQGLCSANSKFMTEPVQIMRLFYHEVLRVFHDRMNSDQDRQELEKMAIQYIGKMGFTEEQVKNCDKILFVDFLQGRENDAKPYQQVEDTNKLLELMNEFQEEYNSEMQFQAGKSSLNLVLFLDACEHICRICRILRQPQGNALLLGIGGSGRQSLSKLSSFISCYRVIQIELVKNYGMRQWREDLKTILMASGIENKPITFLLVDTQIINEQQVEDINSILNSGDVTNLYQAKEMEDIVNACKTECMKKGLQPNKMNIFGTYLNRVKRNFHLIFCMSPIGDDFGTRVKMFPSLVNNCTLDYFTEWPEEALIGVGKGQLLENQRELNIENQRDQLVEMFKNVHKSVESKTLDFYEQYDRKVYVTPKSYIELLSTYQQILKEKTESNNNAVNRLQGGLDKLEYANKEVALMEENLKIKQPQLEVASVEIEKLIKKIEVDKKEASEQQIIVSEEEEIANKQAQEANDIKQQAEVMVADANEKLAQTQEDVKLLETKHLSEIKSFSTPSQAIKTVMGGVCYFLLDQIKSKGGDIIMQLDPDDQFKRKKIENYFETAKIYLLKEPEKLKQQLLSYDKESIKPSTIAIFEKKIKSQPSFNLEDAKKSSFALKFLFLWCDAMYEFDKTFKETAPLREKLDKAEAIVKEKTELLKQKKDSLQVINDKIKDLEDLFETKNREEKELKEDIEDCKVKLSRAQRLVVCLKDEKDRWQSEVGVMRSRANLLAGDSVVAAGMISYSGPFTSDYRANLENAWIQGLKDCKILHSDNLSMRNFMGDPVLIQYWTINCGLPKDDTSTENGIIIEKSKRWPLMIDPQTQANKFIKNMGKEREQGFEVMKASETNIMRTMEKAISYGQWVLIENVGKELDPSWEPILLQETKKEGGGIVIQIGDKQIPYDDKFKFFMTTTMPNPHYSPETSVKVTIINFSITPKGLEEQMLAQLVALENSQMEIKKQEIVKKNAADKKELLAIENGILKSLQEVQEIADVLKDENLILQLQDSKRFASEINQRVEDSKVTEIQIDQARESYRPVAARASLLFFCIIDLGSINPMYQYSLQWFQSLFTMGVQNAPISNVIETRLINLNDYFTYSLYENVCRSLFEVHKLLFSFLLTARMQFFIDALDPNEWRYLLTGQTGTMEMKDCPVDWIDNNAWINMYKDIYGADKLDSMKGIRDYFYNNLNEFKSIYDSNSPHTIELPGGYQTKLNQFQRMIVLKAIRPDKIVPAVQDWITQRIGQKFIMNPTFNLGKCYKDSTILTPLIFVLVSGSDPIADYNKFWDEMGMSKKYDKKVISLGQGQGVYAEQMIKEATQKGGWVLLQNCHLSIGWLSDLEKIVEDLNEGMHKEFRLWLTTFPEKKFPISILQNGIKMTFEPPKGLRNNLLRTYANLDDTILDDCRKPDEFKKLLFGFCLFHAIVQDRRKFGPIGWVTCYDFTNEDLYCCRKQLQTLLNDYDEVPYKVINFLGAKINYGGRVTDKRDKRQIQTILENYINPDVLVDNYKFSDSGMYHTIESSNQQDYINYISDLPLNPSPEAFGLHENAEISNSQQETRYLLSTMLSISSKASTTGGKSREQIIEELATSIEEQKPALFDEEKIAKIYPTDYNESINTVLLQEVIKYNKLLRMMTTTLKDMKLALNGRIGMSDELSQMCDKIFTNEVPVFWTDEFVGYLSMKPLSSWTQDLIEKCSFFANWVNNGIPKVFKFSCFFFPQAFITGIMQNYARRYVIAIDRLSFQFDIKDDIRQEDVTESVKDGCLVYGLFLEGCRWDYQKHQLTDSTPKELFSQIPLIHLVPKIDRQIAEVGIYLCPLYKVESRAGVLLTTGHSTNFVLLLEMPTDRPQTVWIVAGVAAMLSLRY